MAVVAKKKKAKSNHLNKSKTQVLVYADTNALKAAGQQAIDKGQYTRDHDLLAAGRFAVRIQAEGFLRDVALLK